MVGFADEPEGEIRRRERVAVLKARLPGLGSSDQEFGRKLGPRPSEALYSDHYIIDDCIRDDCTGRQRSSIEARLVRSLK
jgi:hypothetical protein